MPVVLSVLAGQGRSICTGLVWQALGWHLKCLGLNLKRQSLQSFVSSLFLSHLAFHLFFFCFFFFLLHHLFPLYLTLSIFKNTSKMPEASLPFGAFSPPQNSYEWKRALLDVKWLCFNQQYKQCALRCNQLIDTASSPVCVSQISSQSLIANGVYG